MLSHTLIGSIRNKAERNVEGLREWETPPLTYRKYLILTDGSEVYLGDYPVPPPNLRDRKEK